MRFPVLIFYYSETKMRSLEEIDLIFTKGYLEKMSYVTATKVLPFLAHLKVWRYDRMEQWTEGWNGAGTKV